MVAKVAPETLLRVSEQCCALYLRAGSTQLTVAELAAYAGISDRTFYRYFPTKAESIAPLFDAMTRTFNAHAAASAPGDVRSALVGAFQAMFTGPVTAQAHELFPLVLADPEMWALFLRKVHDGETTLAPILAAGLGVPADHDRARAAAAAAASATRIALERLGTTGADLVTSFTGLLNAFGPTLLAPAADPAPGADGTLPAATAG